MGAISILEWLDATGLSVEMLDDGNIGVSPLERLTEKLCALIRTEKGSIIAALNANKQQDPDAWRDLDRAYQSHHFICKTCIAAGQGYGHRCSAGAALWTSYQLRSLLQNSA